MARTAKSLEEPTSWPDPRSFGDAAGALLGLIARNPTLVGGSTAFLVALIFVSANALWYQPHAHSGAFFATRDFMRSDAAEAPDETTILIERPDPIETQGSPRQVEGDATVKEVQATLRDLNFYGGEVDGLFGPNTRQAIEAYQAKIGMAVTGAVDESLLDQLGTGSVKPAVLPSPAPRDADAKLVGAKAPAASDERIAKIQAGLKEFGNDGIDIDGLMGARTEAAIREFQSLFGLPVTGAADQTVYAKMKEIGLIE